MNEITARLEQFGYTVEHTDESTATHGVYESWKLFRDDGSIVDMTFDGICYLLADYDDANAYQVEDARTHDEIELGYGIDPVSRFIEFVQRSGEYAPSDDRNIDHDAALTEAETSQPRTILVSVAYGVEVPIPDVLPEGFTDAEDYAQSTAPDMVAEGDSLLIHSEVC